MKKSVLFILMAFGVAFAGTAHAATGDIIPFTASMTVIPDDNCSILSQRATLNVSAGVKAAYQCGAATGLAYGAACHEAGSTNPKTVACACAVDDPTAATLTYSANNTQCACDAAGSPSPVNVEVTGRQAFGGNSNGGSISSYSVSASGAGTCTPATIVGISLFE